jgi:hypothetical protein
MLGLAVLVPPAFATALAARVESPTVTPLPAALTAQPAIGGPLWARGDVWPGLAIDTRLFAPAPGESAPVVELSPARDLLEPTPLVYWADAGDPDRLPPGAVLLGRLGGREPVRLSLPARALARPGRLYLYSLGHGRIVASAPLPEGP